MPVGGAEPPAERKTCRCRSHLFQGGPNAVTDLSRGILSGTMFQLLNDFQRIIHNLAALASSDVDNCTDPAGISVLQVSI